MPTKIGEILKKYPQWYDFINYLWFFFSLHHLKALFLGTKQFENFWGEKANNVNNTFDPNFSTDWIESYWESMKHPHREYLINLIDDESPKSVLEIGSNCGPNLYLLRKKFPEIKIFGIDISAEAIAKGKKIFHNEGIKDVILEQGYADNLQKFLDNSIDVIFTDAVLIYVGPDKIETVIKEIVRVAKNKIILVEWHIDKDSFFDKNGRGRYYSKYYVRNYCTLLKRLAPETQISLRKIPKELWSGGGWGKYGYVITINKT